MLKTVIKILHFNEDKIPNLDPHSNSFDINRLTPIDTISIDDHSRLTLTRKLKKVLPIMPKDTITVYQDKYNKDLIFTIQHESKITDSFIIKTKSSANAVYSNKVIEKNREENNSVIKTERRTLHDINILIVDDEEDILKVFEYFLQSEGYYNIQKFSNPKKAVKHFVELKKADYYELAIIDIRMPGINGIQLYQILKTINPKIKVLFASALDAAFELSSLYNIKEDEIIKKPCEQERFIETINNVVLKAFEIKEKV